MVDGILDDALSMNVAAVYIIYPHCVNRRVWKTVTT